MTHGYRSCAVLGPMAGARLVRPKGRPRARLTIRGALGLAIVGLWAATGSAEVSDDQFPPEPTILTRIIAAAQAHGDPLASELRRDRDETWAYYLRTAHYVGSGAAPFGRVHVARLFFIRSAPKGATQPLPQGHTFVVFLDDGPRVRSYWRVESGLGRLRFDGTKLLLDGAPLFDYAALPDDRRIVVDGAIQTIPVWSRAE